MRSQVDEDGGDACKETNHGATYPPQSPSFLLFVFLLLNQQRRQRCEEITRDSDVTGAKTQRTIKKGRRLEELGVLLQKPLRGDPRLTDKTCTPQKQSLGMMHEMIPTQHNNP
jgi:hypothetical protein